jgi:hypothetical protein
VVRGQGERRGPPLAHFWTLLDELRGFSFIVRKDTRRTGNGGMAFPEVGVGMQQFRFNAPLHVSASTQQFGKHTLARPGRPACPARS